MASIDRWEEYHREKNSGRMSAFDVKTVEEIRKLKEENERLRKALEFYADDKTYEDNSIADYPEFYKMPIADDCGEIAKEALQNGD